jgi:hypothetical protein
MVDQRDEATRVRKQSEIGRLRDELSVEFDDVSPTVIEQGIRSEFERRAAFPVQDFVPVFVERSVRRKLRA